MRIYRLARGWRVVSYLFCGLFTGAAVFLLYIGTSGEFSLWKNIASHAGAIALLFLTLYIFRDTRYGRLMVDEHRITLVSPFRSITLRVDEVRGFRLTENYFILEPEPKRRARIRISTYLENQAEIKDWLYHHFLNLDAVEAEQEVTEILANDDLGLFEESRMKRWFQARRIAKWTNRLGWVISLWVMFYPKPYLVAILAGMILPIAAIGLAYSYRGLMKGGDRDTSAYPSVAEAFVVPGMALLLRALLDYDILFYKNAWVPVLVPTIVLFFLYHFPTGGFSPRKWADYIFLILFPIFTFAYSFGSLLVINCAFDRSEPDPFETKVMSKHFSKGKTTTYYLTLEPWEGLDQPEDVKVSRAEYELAEASDRVWVYQYQGFLDVPWIRVQVHQEESRHDSSGLRQKVSS